MATRDEVRAWQEEQTYSTESAQKWADDLTDMLTRAARLLALYEGDSHYYGTRTNDECSDWLTDWHGEVDDG